MSISVSHQPFNFEKIPPPILRDIFCHESFDMQTLAKVSSLSKYLRSDVFNDTFWKQIVYQRFAFSTKSWQKCFGDQVVSNENLEEELKTCPGIEFLKDVKRFSAIFPETSPYERLALVRVPKTLCGRLYVEVLPKLMGWFIKCPIRHIDYLFCNSTCFYISVQELTIHKSVWVIMTTKVLPDSFDKKFSAQKKLFEHFKINDYQPPKFLETIATIFAYFFQHQVHLFSESERIYTRTEIDPDATEVVVGGFDSYNLHFDLYNLKGPKVGLAAMKIVDPYYTSD